MADLTAELPDPERPGAIRGAIDMKNPGGPGPSVLGGFAEGFAKLLEGSNANRGLQEHQQTLAAQGAVGDAQYQYDKTTETNLTGSWGGKPPADVQSATQGAVASQKAADQGRGTQDQADLVLQNNIDSVLQKYPEQHAAIYEYMKSQGLDHYLFRGTEANARAQISAAAQQEAAEKIQMDAFANHGGDIESTSRADQIKGGAGFLAADAAMKLAMDQSTAAQHNAEATDLQKKQAATDASHTIISNVYSKIDTITGSYTDRINSIGAALAAHPEDKDNQAAFQQLGVQAHTLIESTRSQLHSSMIAAGADPKDFEAVDKELDQRDKALQSLFEGPSSQYGTNQRLLTAIGTDIKLDQSTSMKLFTQIKTIFGDNATTAALVGPDGHLTLDPATLNDLRQEVAGIKPGSADGSQALANVAGILKGVHTLDKTPIGQLGPVINNLVPSVLNLSNNIFHGQQDQQTLSSWANGYGQMINVFHGIGTTQDAASVEKGIFIVSGAGARNAIQVMSKTPGMQEQASYLGESAHNMSVKGLGLLLGAGPNTSSNGVQSIQYNPNTAQFELKFDKNRANQLSNNTGNGVTLDGQLNGNRGGTATTLQNQLLQAPDPQLTSKITSLNLALDAAVKTAQYDKELPAGATPKSLAGFYAKGLPLVGPGGKPIIQQTGTSSHDIVAKQIQDVSGALAKGVDTVLAPNAAARSVSAAKAEYTPIIQAAEAKYGVPAGIGAQIVESESSWGANMYAHDHSPDSHASGLMGLQPGTAAEYGLKVPNRKNPHPGSEDDRMDPSKNIDAGLHYLKDLHDKAVTAGSSNPWMDALHEYTGGQHYSARHMKAISQAAGEDTNG